MARFQFLDFTFCDQTHVLKRVGKECELRPKARQTLLYFLTHPNVLISKKTLFKAVWQTEDVQDHRLFQVISELRKLDSQTSLIRTQPNQGYVWQVPVTILNTESKTTCSHQSSGKFAIAASFIAVASLTANVLLLNQNTNSKRGTSSQTIKLLPASESYGNALVDFKKGNLKGAEQWLNFSLAENPSSYEAQLLLAEVKLGLKQYQQAFTIASKVTDDVTVPNYYYGQSLTLLSRVSLAENQIQDAVSFALEGQRVLEKAPLSCSAIVNNQHIAALLKEVPEDTTDIEALRLSNKQPNLNQVARTHQNNDDLCQQLLAPVTSQIGCIELPSLRFYRKENEQLS